MPSAQDVKDVCRLFACRFVSLRLTGCECTILFTGDICDRTTLLPLPLSMCFYFCVMCSSAVAATENNMPNSINAVCGFSFSSQVFPKAQDNINRMLLEVLARTKC